jgi:hypothetical protein
LVSTRYSPPDFCDFCGSPHPWAGRDALIYRLENILDNQSVDEPTRRKAHEQLEILRQVGLSEDDELRHWRRVKELAPGVLQAGGRILERLVTEAAMKQIGL